MNNKFLATVAISAVVFASIGFVAGLTAPFRRTPAAPTAAPPQPPGGDPCDRSEAAVARRNVFWSLWSGQAPDPMTPDGALAAAVGAIIKPDVTADQRNSALSLYLTKSALYFSPEQLTQAQTDLGEGPQDKRMAMFRYITGIDLDAARLIGCVLADTERVDAFLAGKPVPPETAP